MIFRLTAATQSKDSSPRAHTYPVSLRRKDGQISRNAGDLLLVGVITRDSSEIEPLLLPSS